MRESILDRLHRAPLVFDGAMGTMLYTRGVFVNTCFDEVCLSRPNLVSEVHDAYVAAGADGQAELAARFGPVLDPVRWLLPDLSRLDWRSWPMYGLAPEGMTVALAVSAAAAYAALMLWLAVRAFGRREFS